MSRGACEPHCSDGPSVGSELPSLALLGLLPSPGASPALLAASSTPALLGFRASRHFGP